MGEHNELVKPVVVLKVQRTLVGNTRKGPQCCRYRIQLRKLFLRSLRLPSQWQRDRLVQEYMYRRYTSRNGSLNILQGQNYALNKAFKGLLAGLVHCCIAPLLGGHAPIVWGIRLGGAIVYFGWAWTWLSPSASWSDDDMHKHWSRVAELEKQLFGKKEPDTQEILDQNPGSKQAP